jgi:hypothetical protein
MGTLQVYLEDDHMDSGEDDKEKQKHGGYRGIEGSSGQTTNASSGRGMGGAGVGR